MSFNYLEIEKSLNEIERSINESEEDLLLRSVEFVEFPILKNKETNSSVFSDLCLAFRFRDYSLVFGLKHPWVGLFWLRHGAFRKLKNSSLAGFSLSQFSSIVGQRLTSFEQTPGDRVVKLHFANEVTLQFDLFGMRPNWHLIGETTARWRPETTVRKPARSEKLFEVRELTAPQPWLEAVFQEYKYLKQIAYLKALRAWAADEIEKRMAQLLRVRGAMQDQLRETREVDRLKKAGEALKSVLYQHPPHYKTDRLANFEHELDSQLTLAENADLFFERAKKMQRTSREVTSRLQEIENRIQRQKKLVQMMRNFSIESARPQFEPEYAKLQKLLIEAGLDVQAEKPLGGRESKQKEKMQATGARQFRSKEGLLIWVGRNQEENEKIVIRIANGNDVWMHLKGRPGAHVIVQVPRGKTASLETLLDGATLAAHYSSISENEKVEVDYTFRKYVKRISGVKFAVTYSQNKTLVIKQESERLRRLLAQEF